MLLIFALSSVVQAVVCFTVLRVGGKRAFQRGYGTGRIDAERWWLEKGAEIDKTREAIWKEECR
jgi:hypothetical protein